MKYSNRAVFERGELEHSGGLVWFCGTAEIHERGQFRDKEREINHDGAEEGFAVVIKLERAVNMRGVSVK